MTTTEQGETRTPWRLRRRHVMFALSCAIVGSAFVVLVASMRPPDPEPAVAPAAASAEPVFATKVERGAYLFQTMGCIACHGEGGQGGIANANYIRDTVPALNLMAERFMLFEQAHVGEVIHRLETGTDLRATGGEPPFPRYAVFLAQYDAVRGVIQNGSVAAKKNVDGPAPPLQMPSWRGRLDEDDMDAIIAYLLTTYPWDSAGSDPEADLGEEALGAPIVAAIAPAAPVPEVQP